MKVLLTGTTGFIGGAILNRCLSLPSITQVVVLSRRELATNHAKLTTIIHHDFSSYPDSLVQQLNNVEAVIWSLGNPRSGSNVHLDYTLQAITALLQHRTQPLRLIYVSGALAVREQDKILWLLSDMRKLRGEVENQLAKLQEENRSRLQLCIARPALVLRGNPWWSALISRYSIPVTILAAALVNATQTTGEQHVFENVELKIQGCQAIEND